MVLRVIKTMGSCFIGTVANLCSGITTFVVGASFKDQHFVGTKEGYHSNEKGGHALVVVDAIRTQGGFACLVGCVFTLPGSPAAISGGFSARSVAAMKNICLVHPWGSTASFSAIGA
jgi:hypothetical protein